MAMARNEDLVQEQKDLVQKGLLWTAAQIKPVLPGIVQLLQSRPSGNYNKILGPLHRGDWGVSKCFPRPRFFVKDRCVKLREAKSSPKLAISSHGNSWQALGIQDAQYVQNMSHNKPKFEAYRLEVTYRRSRPNPNTLTSE